MRFIQGQFRWLDLEDDCFRNSARPRTVAALSHALPVIETSRRSVRLALSHRELHCLQPTTVRNQVISSSCQIFLENYKKPACSSSIWLDSKLFQYIIRRIDPASELRDHWLPDFEEKSSMKFLSNNLRFILLYVEIILDMAK